MDIRILVVAGLGCSVLYSTRLFDGIKTAKTFYFIMAVCLMLFFMSGRALLKKKNFTISLSVPDILLALYAAWAFVRLLTSDTDSIYNLYFWEFSACVLWYFCLRFFFSISSENNWEKLIFLSLIIFGYVQFIFCALQLTGIVSSFSPIFPVSGTFDNSSELCIYLTSILPVAVQAGLKASDATSNGKIVRAVCLFYVLSWLLLVLAMGSRTALLSGVIGMGVYAGFQTRFFGYLKGNISKIFVSAGLLFVVCGLVFLLAQYKQDSANGRLLIWKAAWLGIKEAPLHGQGFNAFQAKYGHFQSVYFQQNMENEKEMMIASHMTVAMNDYVETAFNLGLVCLLLFVAFWLSLFKGFTKTKEIVGQARNDTVAVAILVIFFVSSGFYFVEKILPVKLIALFFAAYASNNCKSIVNIRIPSALSKFVVALLLLFSFVAVYATVNKTKHYTQWQKARTLEQFGYKERASEEYEQLYPHLRYDGLFLSLYARNLYENEAYQQCLELMGIAKKQVTGDRFYVLLGDAYFKTGNYENAIESYEYAAYMVPNRFRPLYKLFKLYEELGETQKALAIAQNIVNKSIKVDSYEVQQIKKECINFIYLKEYEKESNID